MLRTKWFFAAVVYFLAVVGVLADNQTGLEFVETADGKRSIHTRNLIQWTHSRLVFNKDIERIAVGQGDFIELEVLGGREVLALAKKVGRTSVIVW